MKPQQIIVLVVLAVADFCVLVAGFAILLSGSRTTQVTPVAVQAAASTTAPPALLPSETPAPPSPTPSPTGTHWPTWTPRASATSLSSRTPSPTPTPTRTPSPVPPTPKPAAATGNPPASGGGAAPAPVVPAATSGPSGCEPNNRPTNGKLDVLWSIVGARGDPADSGRVYVTVQILPSGGGGGYKYRFMGRDYTSGCIEVNVPMCSSTPTDIIVTAANGSQWKDTVMLEAGSNLGFRCK